MRFVVNFIVIVNCVIFALKAELELKLRTFCLEELKL